MASGVGDGGGEWARKDVMAPIIKFPWRTKAEECEGDLLLSIILD